MRSIPVFITALLALALMGVGLKLFPFPSGDFAIASEIADQEVAIINKAAPKFPRRPLLSADVKVMLDRGHGSAVHLGSGLYLTAAHVVADPSKRLDLRFKGGSIRKAEVLWISKERDVALLKASGDGVSSVRLNCSVPSIGDEVTLAGNPMALEDIVAFGRIAGDEREVGRWKSVFVVSGPIIPGQSGGAVYNMDHELIGISVGLALFPIGFSGSASGYGFVVPGRVLCELLARA